MMVLLRNKHGECVLAARLCGGSDTSLRFLSAEGIIFSLPRLLLHFLGDFFSEQHDLVITELSTQQLRNIVNLFSGFLAGDEQNIEEDKLEVDETIKNDLKQLSLVFEIDITPHKLISNEKISKSELLIVDESCSETENKVGDNDDGEDKVDDSGNFPNPLTVLNTTSVTVTMRENRGETIEANNQNEISQILSELSEDLIVQHEESVEPFQNPGGESPINTEISLLPENSAYADDDAENFTRSFGKSSQTKVLEIKENNKSDKPKTQSNIFEIFSRLSTDLIVNHEDATSENSDFPSEISNQICVDSENVETSTENKTEEKDLNNVSNLSRNETSEKESGKQNKDNLSGIKEAVEEYPHDTVYALKVKRECSICQKILKSKSSYEKHMKIVHKLQSTKKQIHGGKTFNCETCTKSFSTERKKILHFFKEHLNEKKIRGSKEEVFECLPCRRSWNGLSKNGRKQFSKHKRSHTLKNFDCGCQKYFETFNERKRHIKIVHMGYIKCDQCIKVMKSEENLAKHRALVHDVENRFQCDQCKYIGTKKQNLINHTLRIHTNPREKITDFQCKECGKLFTDSSALWGHRKRVHNATPCPLCGKVVKILKLHMSRLHTEDSDKPIKCDQCGQGFVDPSNLKSHMMNVHIKARPFKCRALECAQHPGFNDAGNRNAHERRKHKHLDFGARDNNITN